MANSNNDVTIIAKSKDVNKCIESLQASGLEVEIRGHIDQSVISVSPDICVSDSKEGMLVEKTCKYLTAHLDTKQMLDDIAYAVGSNRTQLAAVFKKVTGMTVFQWLRTQRLEAAKQLLINTELSIQNIGFEVGYENTANFSTAYKQHFGVSPRNSRIKSHK